MAGTDSRKQTIVGYALIGGFIAFFIFFNWAGLLSIDRTVDGSYPAVYPGGSPSIVLGVSGHD